MDAPPPRPPDGPRADPYRRLWAPVTIRCAWDLLLAGQRPRGGKLRLVREHALLLVPPGADLAEAEGIASAAVGDYLARERGVYAPFTPDPDLGILPDPAWREGFASYADPVHDIVLRFHFGDGLPLEEVSHRRGVELAHLRAARASLLELARERLQLDGVPVQEWDAARLERMVRRIAQFAGDQCPGPGGIATEAGRAHAERCPRCSRALRLLREGEISLSDLFPPEDAPSRPQVETPVLALELHPDARRWRKALVAALQDAIPVERDLWLLPERSAAASLAEVRSLAEHGAPPASRLRIGRYTLQSRLVTPVVPGLDVLRVMRSLRTLEWGATEGVEPLPEPLPPPPSAARWWTGGAVLALVTLLVGLWAFLPGPPRGLVALEGERTASGVRFDTADEAWVEVVAVRGGTATLAFHSDHVDDKGTLATGDGRYALAVDADQVVLIAGRERFEELAPVLDAGTTEIEARLRDRFPGAAVLVLR